MCVRVCCRWNFLSGAPTSIYAIRQMGRLAFGAHRGECLEQFRLVPRHIDDVIAQVAAVGVAQPFLRKPHEEALFPFIEVAARRRLCAGQRRLQRCPMIDVAQAASMASRGDPPIDLQHERPAGACRHDELDEKMATDAEAGCERFRDRAQLRRPEVARDGRRSGRMRIRCRRLSRSW